MYWIWRKYLVLCSRRRVVVLRRRKPDTILCLKLFFLITIIGLIITRYASVMDCYNCDWWLLRKGFDSWTGMVNTTHAKQYFSIESPSQEICIPCTHSYVFKIISYLGQRVNLMGVYGCIHHVIPRIPDNSTKQNRSKQYHEQALCIINYACESLTRWIVGTRGYKPGLMCARGRNACGSIDWP